MDLRDIISPRDRKNRSSERREKGKRSSKSKDSRRSDKGARSDKKDKNRSETEKDISVKVSAVPPGPTIVKVGSQEILQRHVNQLFIRGDNVVMVSLVD